MEAGHKDSGKTELQYILAMKGLDEVAKVGSFGAKKYDQWNYMAGMPWMKLAGSIARHLTDWIRGHDKDEESGLHPLAHLVYDALMLLEYDYRKVGKDDRYKVS
jgi:hypothetical protein